MRFREPEYFRNRLTCAVTNLARSPASGELQSIVGHITKDDISHRQAVPMTAMNAARVPKARRAPDSSSGGALIGARLVGRTIAVSAWLPDGPLLFELRVELRHGSAKALITASLHDFEKNVPQTPRV